MHRHKKNGTKKKAQASVSWTRALGCKRTGKPLTPSTIHSPNGKVNRKMLTTAMTAQLRPVSERKRVKEEWLRLEIRENRRLVLAMYRWGVAVLAGLESSLYFIRHDVAIRLAGGVPLERWLAGTCFLTMIAFIFCKLASYSVKRHVDYRKQLIKMKPSYSGIVENGLANGRMHNLHFYLFYAFPLFDFVLWFYFRVAGSLTIKLDL
jgi:hypothetical protein